MSWSRLKFRAKYLATQWIQSYYKAKLGYGLRAYKNLRLTSQPQWLRCALCARVIVKGNPLEATNHFPEVKHMVFSGALSKQEIEGLEVTV